MFSTKHTLLMASTLLGMTACAPQGGDTSADADIIGRYEATLTSPHLTAELLQHLGRVSGVQPSPDGQKLLYGVTYTSIEQNKSNRELYVINVDGTDNHSITRTAKSEQNAVWLKDGRIAFLSSESGSNQIWVMDADGKNRRQVSHFKLPAQAQNKSGESSDSKTSNNQSEECDIEGFVLDEAQQQVIIIAPIKIVNAAQSLYPDLDKASGQIFDDLMYRHWNDFVTDYPHPFLARFDGSEVSTEVRDLLEGEPYECPMRPFGGTENFTFSPDGQRVVYACRKKTGKEYALSTNSDLYLYDIPSGKTVNLTSGMSDMEGYDTAPKFSPDGTKLAWCSMARDGYESDKQRLMLLDMSALNAATAESLEQVEIGQPTDLTAAYRDNCDDFVWAPQGDAIFFLSYVEATCQIYRSSLDAVIERVSDGGDYDFSSITFAGQQLIATRHSMSAPDDIYAVNEADHTVQQLTFENKHLLDQLELGRVEKRWMRSTNGDSMLVWVALPAGFDRMRAEDPERRFPTLLYCQGGPQSPVSQFWSIRWNVQMMQGQGYAVVLPNRHGVPGFGQPFNEQISGDYSGQCIDDYLTAIDEVAKEPWCDRDHLGAVGASFGGYSVYYLAGHHEKRFKCFIAHAGIFNLESMYGETEESWFCRWDLGGGYWEKDNKTAQRSYANSPHKAVGEWDTPILVIHGEKDFRIPATEGMQAFNAARLRGVPAEMLYFPDECHWIQQPQNCVLWQRVFFAWLDKWLKVSAN